MSEDHEDVPELYQNMRNAYVLYWIVVSLAFARMLQVSS